MPETVGLQRHLADTLQRVQFTGNFHQSPEALVVDFTGRHLGIGLIEYSGNGSRCQSETIDTLAIQRYQNFLRRRAIEFDKVCAAQEPQFALQLFGVTAENVGARFTAAVPSQAMMAV